MPTMNEAQARAHLVATALGEVGYDATPRHSRYGSGSYWPHDSTWEWQGLWCARGASWTYAKAFGVEAAIAGIGKQPSTPLPAGWAATWLWREHLRDNDLWVGFPNAKPGDIIFYRFPNPGGGRGKNPTNHVSLVVENRGNYLRCVGFNTPRPGAGGDPDAGGGVWLHNRYLTSVVVAVYQANWPALLTVYNAQQAGQGIQDLTEHAEALAAFGYPATEAGVRGYQTLRSGPPHNLVIDGIFGPKTQAALEADMATLESIAAEQARQAKQLDTIEWAARKASNDALYRGPNKVVARMVPIINAAADLDESTLAGLIADDMTPELVEAVKAAGTGATASEVADEFARRLNETEETA